MYRKLSLMLIAAATLAFSPAIVFGADLSGRALVDALRQGGYNIYFRHAATVSSQTDRIVKAGDWTSCDPARMRQLSEYGRAQAKRIGELMRVLAIPVTRVLTSEYCRAKETGELLAVAPVTPTRAIMNMYAADFVGGRDKVIERAREEFGRIPVKGANAVFVGHGNLTLASSGNYTVEGGATVFKPAGNGEFEVVAVIEPDEWEELAKLYRQ